MERSGKFVKAHIIYKNEAGKRVPGVTTVLGILNKPLLVPWANRIGLQGINVKDYVSDKADIGTLVHEMMFTDLANMKAKMYPDQHLPWEEVDENCVPLKIKGYFTGIQLEIATNSYKKYLEWKKEHTIVPIILEEGGVSEKYQYGGTIDNYCLLDGVPTLIDYKTCKALYSEHFYQVAGYRQILREMGHKVKVTSILKVGRSENEGFEFKKIPNKKMALCWTMFKYCLKIYQLKKQLR